MIEFFLGALCGVAAYLSYKALKDLNALDIEQEIEASDMISKLRTRAQIRRQASDRKSVQEGRPDRLADQLEHAADLIERLKKR